MKKISALFTAIILVTLVHSACSTSNNDVDKEVPVIDISMANTSPQNCDTIYFGEPFTINLRFEDNVELGSTSSYNINIHHNFDHHSHTTEVSTCSMDPVKTPVHPYTSMTEYDIPAGQKTYVANFNITIPEGPDANTLYDEGDYHFFISLTDKEGWSTQKGLSIKLMHRD